MKQPLVTIGIPTFNRAGGYLGKAIENCLNQSYRNIELVVSDNCSTDHTSDVVGSFRDPRIRYIRHERNLGQLGNTNSLVEAARGDFLIINHDDDILDPDIVESCLHACDFRSDVGLIVTGCRVINQDGLVVRSKNNPLSEGSGEEMIFAWYRQKIHLWLCNCMFGTRALKKHGFKEKYGNFHDTAAMFECASDAGAVHIGEVKASFREHSGSQTSAANMKAVCDSSMSLLSLAISLAGDAKPEIKKVGWATTAERNYRLAVLSGTPLEKLARVWKVYQHLGYRRLPKSQHLRKMVERSPFGG